MDKSVGRNFMHASKYANMGLVPQKEGQKQPPLELPYAADAELIALPALEQVEIPPLDLHQAVALRVSLRGYAEKALTLGELSYLLWGTQGLRQPSDGRFMLRTVPSAGARHAFETYLLINRVKGLASGLYRYIASRHALLRMDFPANIGAQISTACLNQHQINDSAVTFLWVAVVERMTWRYGERGYRYLHLDAGHVCQNLYLLAEQLGCGVCAIAAFNDDALNEALHLDGEEQFAIYLGSLGKRP